jgi:hypothetical protein
VTEEKFQRPGFEHFPKESEQYIDHPSHAKPGIHAYPDRLYVCTMLENPLRWRSRYKNYWKFEKMCADAGAILYTAEIAFGGRDFEITEPGNPRHLQLRSHDELLHKENALNLLIQRLPATANKIATLDADIQFARSDWAQETLHLLDHYKVLQMFSHSMDLGPAGEPRCMHESFVMHELANYPHHPLATRGQIPPGPMNPPFVAGVSGARQHGPGCTCPPCPPPYYEPGKILWHPGFAWAWRKIALNQLGGLMDWLMGGAADHYMALALFNRLTNQLYFMERATKNYRAWAYEWQTRAERHIRRNVGYMPGVVVHDWHGPQQSRQYASRELLVGRLGFDPVKHIKRDWQGLWQLHDDGSLNYIQIRDGLRQYARMRDEDSNSV